MIAAMIETFMVANMQYVSDFTVLKWLEMLELGQDLLHSYDLFYRGKSGYHTRRGHSSLTRQSRRHCKDTAKA